MSTVQFQETLTFAVLTCPHADCGIHFGVPCAWERRRREDRATFHCPNGHPQSFTKSLLDATTAERDAARRAKDAAETNAKFWRERNEATERSARALRGKVTMLKNRVAKGKCPCCSKSFADVAEHMKATHPDYAESK